MTSFAQKLAELKAAKAAQSSHVVTKKEVFEEGSLPEIRTEGAYVFGGITLNEQQSSAVDKAKRKESFVLTGAAGTGKTATQAAVVEALNLSGSFGVHDFKYLGGAPSIAIVAFTKVAVRNIQKALNKNPATKPFVKHCMTIHTLLEYEPVKQQRVTAEGQPYEVKVFIPKRDAENPLHITHLIIEEASMVGLDLWSKLHDALEPGVQIIYLGDINQIPPVFGKSIMSYALCKLPVIELTHVYRQALDNPIVANAHKVLKGEMVSTSADGRFSVVTGKDPHQVGQAKMASGIIGLFKQLDAIGDYNPDTDMILSPWGKQECGTTNINEKIASFLGAKRKAIVTPIQAGFTRVYLAVGDKVLVDKQTGWITKIETNPSYLGSPPPAPGYYSRDGLVIIGMSGMDDLDFDADGPVGEGDLLPDYSNINLDDIEEDMAKRAASHIVTVTYSPPQEEELEEGEEGPVEDVLFGDSVLKSSGDFAETKFQFGYALTFHKAQGSEYRKVYIVLHQDHMGFLSRELIYTGMTRAREECTFLCKADLLNKAIIRQKIAGTSLAEKISYFNGGSLLDLDSIPVTKEEEPEE